MRANEPSSPNRRNSLPCKRGTFKDQRIRRKATSRIVGPHFQCPDALNPVHLYKARFRATLAKLSCDKHAECIKDESVIHEKSHK